jgi:ribonuclease-3 family protein
LSDRAKIWYNTLVVSVKDASFGMPVFFGHMKEEMPLTLREEAPMTKDDARRLNPLQLAYIGDTVYDLLTRSRLLYRGYNLHHCHQAAVTVVNAHAQAEALTRIEGALTEEETSIVRRGRNTHAHHAAPRNQTAMDYQAATALEALVGYLYLTGQETRLLELFRKSQEVASCPAQP